MKITSMTETLTTRLANFRSDESASVLMMSGMMAFLLAIFGMYVLDTYQGVYGRIRAQNAVDAAAETAALTQARGLNLLQHLNNFHYIANIAFAVAEAATLTTCVTAAPAALEAEIAACTVGLLLGPGPCNAAIKARDAVCKVCAFSSDIDDAQANMATVVVALQRGVAKVFPVLTFMYANQVAAQAGAEDLKVVLPKYTAKAVERAVNWLGPLNFGIDSSTLSSAIGSIGDFLDTGGFLEVHAIPLDFDSLSLHVWEEEGGKLPFKPWVWPGVAKTAARVAYWFVGFPSCLLSSAQGDFKSPDSGWGWDDVFYNGHPGFMTWVAGVKGRRNWAGLENLRWMGYATTTGQADSMFVGNYLGSEVKDWVPPFIAFASSQVEGTGLSDYQDADARATLIPVYFSQTYPGTEFPIIPILH